jgi:diadenosine tetraphosphatase ApaH/serine/threonine PP2A family protein phosphatase
MPSAGTDWPAWIEAIATVAAVAAAVIAAVFARMAYQSQSTINKSQLDLNRRLVQQVEERFASLIAWWFEGRPVADEDSVQRRLYGIPSDDELHVMETIKIQNRSAVPIRHVKYAVLPAGVADPTWWRLPDIPPFTVAKFEIRHYGHVIHNVLYDPDENARALFFEDPVGRWRWGFDGLSHPTKAEWNALISFPPVRVQILLAEENTERL